MKNRLLLSALFLLIPAGISAQQSDLIEYFPHNVGDLWQYEEMSTTLQTVTFDASGLAGGV